MREENLSKITVRAFRDEDSAPVRLLARETALAGRSADLFLGEAGADVFVEALTAYYFDFEPDNAYVAVMNHQVVGYLLGCYDSEKQNNIFRKKILPRVISLAIKNATFTDTKSLFRAGKTFISFIRGEFKRPPHLWKHYPAHLHINLDETVRGRGVGAMLMSEYISSLKRRGIKGVHLESMADGAVSFFQSQGFKIVTEKPLNVFNDIRGGPRFFRIMVRELNSK